METKVQPATPRSPAPLPVVDKKEIPSFVPFSRRFVAYYSKPASEVPIGGDAQNLPPIQIELTKWQGGKKGKESIITEKQIDGDSIILDEQPRTLYDRYVRAEDRWKLLHAKTDQNQKQLMDTAILKVQEGQPLLQIITGLKSYIPDGNEIFEYLRQLEQRRILNDLLDQERAA